LSFLKTLGKGEVVMTVSCKRRNSYFSTECIPYYRRTTRRIIIWIIACYILSIALLIVLSGPSVCQESRTGNYYYIQLVVRQDRPDQYRR